MFESCYVCQGDISLEMLENKTEGWSYICHRQKEDGTLEYRHLWHGVPGITRAMGGGGGFNGYAPTLELAKQRAEYYINNNPWAAPEVIAGEVAVLDAVKFEETNNA